MTHVSACFFRLSCWNFHTFATFEKWRLRGAAEGLEDTMNGIIYIVGLIVVVMAVLSLIGLR